MHIVISICSAALSPKNNLLNLMLFSNMYDFLSSAEHKSLFFCYVDKINRNTLQNIFLCSKRWVNDDGTHFWVNYPVNLPSAAWLCSSTDGT